MDYLISLLIGYSLGSFPSAYIILKKTKNIDITLAGTGNVGAMNSFDVSKSKLIGIAVLLSDALKGILPIIILKLISIDIFAVHSISLFACVFSHCYNPWLKFKGGRGLASAAGGTAMIFPFALVVWGVLWSLFFLLRKNITISNVSASIMTLVIIMLSKDIAFKYTYPRPDSESSLILFATGIIFLIISKHTEPLKKLLTQINTKRRVRK